MIGVSNSFRDTLWFRIGFIALLGTIGASFRPFGLNPVFASVCGVLIGLLAAGLDWLIRGATAATLAAAATGMFVGTALGLLAVAALPATGSTFIFFHVAVPLMGAYIGVLAGGRQARVFEKRFLGGGGQPALTEDSGVSPKKILDTSVLIDGRIADVAQAGFVQGPLVVPAFVLHELQIVADSADGSRRNRGRRGLDVVRRLQETQGVEVDSQDFPQTREVDLKLIELAKMKQASIVTNDFNLSKLASVHGVAVLNMNELANALKPVVIPGEVMRVFISKEGKEANQGVAYLDDGTMVVVDNARRLISKTVDITVTSVLQTTAGKMIFGKYDERGTQSDVKIPTSSYTAGSL